ncbi:hypothetical protein SAMN05444156_2385 [Verrucomicrobium sp. GAS474]|uniref:hypothetical protein n=1 Tax=Verrucomicrobium sp. GAS474 TaxID=1882831 RepID=UPI00087C4DA6|nr:hypothetical protein [Verrucomicrobium sp. GAS474]SDU17023.1 hypothetical protein SAMN05444156_2385 [Verrucomicrobium sp. GAS474]
MLLIVAPQNGFLEKCNSGVLKSIVEAADLMEDVYILKWQNPPDWAFEKAFEEVRLDYDRAIYPELEQMGLPTIPMHAADDLPQVIRDKVKTAKEVFVIGANVHDWLQGVAAEVWSQRVKPQFFYDAWFTPGKGTHATAIANLTRQFGAKVFHSWELYGAPLRAKKEAAAKAAAEAATFNPESDPEVHHA